MAQVGRSDDVGVRSTDGLDQATSLDEMTTAAAVRTLVPPALRPATRRIADAVIPARRRNREQWSRIMAAGAAASGIVQSGPFRGMQLLEASTGSHLPKLLGCYEQELHEVVQEISERRPATIVDIGCGEGFYVVGLARLLPEAQVIGYDISPQARLLCRQAAEHNGVAERVDVRGECAPDALARWASPGTVMLLDAEGAEDGLLTQEVTEALGDCLLVVELHDFAAPGVTRRLGELLGRTHDVSFIEQQGRDRHDHPLLSALSDEDAERALNESRVPEQQWLVARPRH